MQFSKNGIGVRAENDLVLSPVMITSRSSTAMQSCMLKSTDVEELGSLPFSCSGMVLRISRARGNLAKLDSETWIPKMPMCLSVCQCLGDPVEVESARTSITLSKSNRGSSLGQSWRDYEHFRPRQSRVIFSKRAKSEGEFIAG